ncbi:hypothetical protein [Polaromonas sp. CG9_12]|nr:hypothetical protein [Polaromonas sp. CG9_12]
MATAPERDKVRGFVLELKRFIKTFRGIEKNYALPECKTTK